MIRRGKNAEGHQSSDWLTGIFFPGFPFDRNIQKLLNEESSGSSLLLAIVFMDMSIAAAVDLTVFYQRTTALLCPQNGWIQQQVVRGRTIIHHHRDNWNVFLDGHSPFNSPSRRLRRGQGDPSPR